MTLTKESLKDSVSSQLNIPKVKASALVESFLETIKEALKSGEDVMISGFGKFSVKNKDERRGRNPKTGKEVMIAPRKVVRFSCSGKLRESMNGGEKT
jgi:integration host factor subunit alpha